jgi:hypothetical protein
MLCLSGKLGNYQCSELTRENTMFSSSLDLGQTEFACTRGGAGAFGHSAGPLLAKYSQPGILRRVDSSCVRHDVTDHALRAIQARDTVSPHPQKKTRPCPDAESPLMILLENQRNPACQLGHRTQTKQQHSDTYSISTNLLHLPGLVFTTGTSSCSTTGTSC